MKTRHYIITGEQRSFRVRPNPSTLPTRGYTDGAVIDVDRDGTWDEFLFIPGEVLADLGEALCEAADSAEGQS